jgi:hypothetical protein
VGGGVEVEGGVEGVRFHFNLSSSGGSTGSHSISFFYTFFFPFRKYMMPMKLKPAPRKIVPWVKRVVQPGPAVRCACGK